MKKILTGMLAMLAMLGVSAQNASYNDPNAEVRNVGGFTGIKVSSGIELVLSQGNTEAVAVSAANAEERQNIKTEVKEGVLKIYYDNGGVYKGRNRNTGKLRAYVSAVTLKLLHASAGAAVKVDGMVKAANLDVDLSSGATLKGAFAATDLSVSQSSGAVAKFSGSADKLSVSVNSGANFWGYELAVGQCKVKASSGGNVEITVNSELDAHANSGGNIRYKGSCTVIKANTNSGGSIKNKTS
jgi:hypothetical protein